jgi:hypothetical protein
MPECGFVEVTADNNGGNGLDVDGISLVVLSRARNNAQFGLRTDCPTDVLRLTASGNQDDLHLGGTGCALLKTPVP